MKIILISSIIILLSFSLFAQDEPIKINNKIFGEVVFYKDFLSFISDKPGLTRVDIFVQVPYKSIQFIKSSEGFTAKYSITASIFDTTKTKLKVEKTWNETVNVLDYSITTSKENYNLSKKSFDLKPGSYLIRIALEDLDSRKVTTSENIVVVKDFDKKISLSDILLISKTENPETNNSIVPNISRNILSSHDRIRIYMEANSQDSIEKKYKFEYNVTNVENKIIQHEGEERNIKPGLNQIVYNMSEFPFELGAYVITVTISDDQNTIIDSTKKSFYSKIKGLPSIINDIDKAIAQTVYLATPDELDYMEEGKTQAEKTKRFLDFWKKKDPSPNNDENEMFDEYFKRVEYANENFSNYFEGWRSDRGMVFILLGAPNNVDRHPFETDSKPYEIWEYYNLNRSLIFLDETGFGDYRLITPLTGDLYRYRN